MTNTKHNPYIGTFHGINRKDLTCNIRTNVVDSKNPLLPMFRHAPPQKAMTTGVGLKSLLFEDSEISLKPFVSQVQVSENIRKSKKHLSSEILRHLPLSIYDLSSSSGCNNDLPICSICLECFKDGDELRTLECSHCYHRNCIDIWLIGCLSDELTDTCNCPQCRQVIGTSINQATDIPSSVFLRIGESLSQVDMVSDITSDSASVNGNNRNIQEIENVLEEIGDELLHDNEPADDYDDMQIDKIDEVEEDDDEFNQLKGTSFLNSIGNEDILSDYDDIEEEYDPLSGSKYSDCGYPLKPK